MEREERTHQETKVRFFVEEHPENLHGEPRHQVLARILDLKTCQFLEDRGWGVSIAMIDLDEPTARLIKGINQQFPRLPVPAWIVVDDQDGYWTNKFNVSQTRQKVEETKAWADRFNLDFEAIGFDLEPPIALVKATVTSNYSEMEKQLRKVIQKIARQAGYSPEDEMEDLVRSLRKEQITTHSYEMPGLLSLPFFGVLQIKGVNTRVTMVYSTQGLRRTIEGKIPTIALKKGTFPAIGVYSSTGHIPGRNFGEVEPVPSNRNALYQDIRSLTQKATRDESRIMSNLWVFALNGIRVAQWTKEALEKASQGSINKLLDVSICDVRGTPRGWFGSYFETVSPDHPDNFGNH